MPIYDSSIPYLLATRRNISLPRGDRSGYGNLVFLLSPSLQDSLNMINSRFVSNDNKYYYYYYEVLYKGKINSVAYNIRDIEGRKTAYEYIADNTNIHPYPLKPFDSRINRNTYYDLFKYLSIFYDRSSKLTPMKKINAFWEYTKSVILSDKFNSFDRKIILVNAENYTTFKGKINELLNNPLFILYYTMYKYADLIKDIDIDFIIYCRNYILKINPSKCVNKDYNVFKRELNRIFSRINGVDIEKDLNVSDIDKEIQKSIVKEAIAEKYNFMGNVEEDENINNKIDSKIDKSLDQVKEIIGDDDNIKNEDVSKIVKSQVENDINDDKELLKDVYSYTTTKTLSKSPLSSKRDEELRKKQKLLKLENMTLEEISNLDSNKVVIPKNDISKSVKTTNDNMKEIKFANYDKLYDDTLMKKDIVNAFTALNNKSIPMYIKSIDVMDASDELNYKDTYKIVYEDENRKQHSVTVDVPKFLDNKFLYLGGTKKFIGKQNFFYPVVKCAPDTVQLVSNYNKLFMKRISGSSISSVSKISKVISTNDEARKFFDVGSAFVSNHEYLTFLEYDEFSKLFTRFKHNKVTLYFKQDEALEYVEKNKIKVPENKIFVGIDDEKPILFDMDTQRDENDKTLSEIIFENLPEEIEAEVLVTNTGTRLMYTQVTIMEQDVPLALIICYFEGLTTVLKKANVKYLFSEKRPTNLSITQSYIQFKDGYMVYESTIPTQMILNGLTKKIKCSDYTFAEMNNTEPYVSAFKKIYGKINITNALINFYEFFIDPVTLEILNTLDLPLDFVNLTIYGNNLLCDSSASSESKQYLMRVRCHEIVPMVLYKVLADNYVYVRNSGGKQKLSIKKDAVIKRLLELPNVENYDTLNPIVEIEKMHTISPRGWIGVNKERAYTMEKRSYDPTMLGVVAMTTTTGGTVGITRFLSLEPTITNARGFVDIKYDKPDELKDVNVYSPAEMITTMGTAHDDPNRTAMAAKQSKHTVPTKETSPVLISNGMDETLRFRLSSDFSVIAEEDGEVLEKNDKTEIMVVKYKSGKIRAVDLSNHIVKNGSGGFYLSNQLVTKLEAGSKFKKNDTLAIHKDFFTDSKISGTRLNIGPLAKVAIMSTYNNYQDCTFITETLSEKCATDIIYEKTVVLGKNSNIDFIKNIGEHINVGEPLIQFDTSFDDSELNKMLDKLSGDLKETINESSKNSIKSKHSGEIVNIEIFAAVELEEMSPSLRSLVDDYYKKINAKYSQLNKYDKTKSNMKCGLFLTESAKKTEPNKYGLIQGHNVEDSVMLRFYIKHTDYMGVGDKLT